MHRFLQVGRGPRRGEQLSASMEFSEGILADFIKSGNLSVKIRLRIADRKVVMVEAIPLDRLLTETDGPFTKTAERPSKPVDVAVVVEALGQLHGLPAATLAATVRNNLRILLEESEEGTSADGVP